MTKNYSSLICYVIVAMTLWCSRIQMSLSLDVVSLDVIYVLKQYCSGCCNDRDV